MGRVLSANIAVRNPATGVVETFVAGATPPAWAAERITNEAVWTSDVEVAPAAAPADVERPPTAGKGSGRDQWAAYAATVGVEVSDNASRDDIIAAVDARN